MEVISAQGTTVKLFERSCSNTNSTLMLSYDDSGADLACCNIAANGSSFQALAAFNGKPSRDWTFRIRDAYETDAGMLNSASINICKIIPWLNPILN
jgi:hypothetical protein